VVRFVNNTGKNIAIAILGKKSIAILIALLFSKLILQYYSNIFFAILHYLFPPNEF